jgi:hypothetical protein
MGSINGHAITGSNYGTTASPCWDAGGARQIYNFVADVTAFANLVGANSLTGFASGGPPVFGGVEPLAEGASLIVVYSNPASSGHQVDIYQGARTFDGPSLTPPAETLTLSGYTAVAGTSHTTWVVADGQPLAPPNDNKTFVDNTLTAASVLSGIDGDFWDTRTQDVTAFVPPADTSIQIGTESGVDFGTHDCISWVAQVLSTPINATTFSVAKAYSPIGPVTSVPVSVTCTSGSPTSASGNSAPGTPFTITNIGFITPASCSASETVPPGYIESDNCASVSLINNVPASCTITNTETSTTFTVNKVYSPAGPLTPVPVTVTCSSGIVTTPSGNAAPAAPFSTVVHKFNVSGTTCSATETLPSGYAMVSTTCTNVLISNGVPASCTFTNTLAPTPNPSAVGGLVDVLTAGGSSGSGGASNTWLAVIALAVIAVGTVAAGGTLAFVRKRS